jgi:hypothetical protein
MAPVTGGISPILASAGRPSRRWEAAQVLDSVRETIRIGEEGGLPTQITHHKTIGQVSWRLGAQSLKLDQEPAGAASQSLIKILRR